MDRVVFPMDDEEKAELARLSGDTGRPVAVLWNLRRRGYAVVELDDEADQR